MARELRELEEATARVFDLKDEEGYTDYFRASAAACLAFVRSLGI